MSKSVATFWVGLLGGVAALGGSATAFWPMVGWVTPNMHQEDVDSISAEYSADVDKILELLDRNHAEWKCDEYDEELEDALQARRDGDDSLETERKIEKLRLKMAELDCQSFEDFG